MKKFVKVISIVLVVAMIAPIVSLSGLAANETNKKNLYPIVFVHGMLGWGTNEGINRLIPYWGATTGNAVDYLTDEGYECYSASVGPLSSVWDQACELYAQLAGTRVDYGAAHSKEMDHKRYGRTYDKPLFEGWGENGKKVHLIGHSFGGNTVRLLTYLLTYGCPEEMNACSDPSPLFEGGHEDLIATCTAMCSPINGSTAYNVLTNMNMINFLLIIATLWAATFGRSPANGRLVDFHLEQFGISDIPGDPNGKADPFLTAVPKFFKTEDNVKSLISIDDCAKFNEMIEPSDNVYYFSVAYNCTTKVNDELYRPKNYDFILLSLFANMMIGGIKFDQANGSEMGNEWLPNDGLVNVISALYPFDEPHKDYDKDNIERGIWNVLPVRDGDHGTPIGLFANSGQTKDFLIEFLDIIISTEPNGVAG